MLLTTIPSARSIVLVGALLTLVTFISFQWHADPTAHSPTTWKFPDLSSLHLTDYPDSSYASENVSTSTAYDDGGGPLFDAQVTLWKTLQPILAAANPNCPPPKREGKSGAIGYEANKNPPRPDLTTMSFHDIEAMKKAHQNIVNTLQSDLPQIAYEPETRGLVTTAGGKYLPVFVISLRMLRRTGSSLPMEVFLASEDEYEPEICDNVLPDLNARCVVLSRITSQVPATASIQHYQLKCFAMLFSSFEEILFLDADAFPIYDPAMLFEAEPFVSSKFVLWPDFWASTASPLYYKIANVPQPAMSARQSSETGEIIVSKRVHAASLMLATYYNYYGPSHYYILLSQGAPGEGDKETFAAAADALGQNYYHVSEKIVPIGRPKKEGGMAGSAMVQHDPIEDYNLTSQGLWRVKDNKIQPKPKAFFVHANFPKFNPVTIFHEGGPTWNADGTESRAWTVPADIVEAFDFDVERRFWEEIKGTACDYETKFASWQGMTGICARVEQYWGNVFGSPLEKILEHHEPKQEVKSEKQEDNKVEETKQEDSKKEDTDEKKEKGKGDEKWDDRKYMKEENLESTEKMPESSEFAKDEKWETEEEGEKMPESSEFVKNSTESREHKRYIRRNF